MGLTAPELYIKLKALLGALLESVVGQQINCPEGFSNYLQSQWVLI